jgi:hypothetical protein
MARSRTEFTGRDPYLGPDARWEEAHRISVQMLRTTSTEDALVQDAADYLRICHVRNADAAAARHPQIALAVAIWTNPATRETLQILALANCPRAEGAERLAVTEDVIDAAEGLFFDVRARLRACAWIFGHVLRPAPDADPAEATERLAMAYYGGPLAAHALLGASDELPWSQAKRLFDFELQLHIKAQAALAMPLTPKSQVAIVKAFADIQLRRQRLQLAEEKFRFRMREADRKFQIAQARLAHSKSSSAQGEPPARRSSDDCAAVIDKTVQRAKSA